MTPAISPSPYARWSSRLLAALGALSTAVLLPAGPAMAQTPPGEEPSVVTWPRSVDAMRGSPWDLSQTGDGRLWIATEEGLLHFDGADLRSAGRDGPGGVVEEWIRALAVQDDSILWLGTADRGLARYTQGRVSLEIGAADGLPSNSVYALELDETGTLWVGTTNGIVRVRGDSVMATGLDPESLPGRFVEDLERREEGGMWVATRDGGLYGLLADGRVEPVEVEGAPPRDARALTVDTAGTLWVATARGLFRLDRSSTPEPVLQSVGAVDATVVNDVLAASDGSVWAAVAGTGVARLRNGRWRMLSAAEDLPEDDPMALDEDDRGGVWVATRGGGGLARIRDGPITSITEGSGLAAAIALPVLQTTDGTLWVGSFGAGATRLGPGGIDTLSTADGLPDDVVLALAEDSAGGVWMGTRAGATRSREGRLRTWGTDEGLPSPAVLTILPLSSGRILLGTNNGVAMLDEDDVRVLGTPEGDLRVPVFAMAAGASGDVWVGTNGAGAYRLEGDSLLVRAEALQSEIVYDFFEEADGSVWIATQSEGLVRYRNGQARAVGPEDGLFDSQVYRILPDGQGRFWMCSNRGIFTVAVDELRAVADGEAERVESPMFSHSWGMPSTECNGGIQPAGWRARDGRLHFPTMEGVAVVDPDAALAAYRRPPVPVVTSIRATNPEGVAMEVGSELVADTRRVTFHYTATAFSGGESLEFQFRLAPNDEEWSEGAEERLVEYTNLAPGTHTLFLRARRPGAPWGEERATAVVTLPPLFHQTLFFRGLVVTAVLLLVAGIHALRVRHLRRREEELLALVRERELAEARYRELLENATDVIFTLDVNGRVNDLNAEALRALGRDRDALVGQLLRESLTPESARELSNGLVRLIADEHDVIQMQVTAIREDGAEVVLDLRLRGISDGDRRIGIQGMARDVTEKLELERQLLQSQKMETVGRLTGGIAHDFNNLLTAIRGFADLAGNAVSPDDAVHDDLREIVAAAERATALTRRLLTFGRTRPVSVERLDLNEVVRDATGLLTRLLGEDVLVEIDLSQDPLSVEVDRVQLEQVLLNLAVNARDAMTGGGRIVISTWPEDDDRVVLTVSDTGKGIEPEHLQRIFEPFFTTKGPDGGTGLGLATVQAIVQEAGGEIEVDSTPGRGTTIRIGLPAAAPSPPREAAVQSSGLPGQATVLVVDDDPAVRRIIERLLVRAEYQVMTASGKTEARSVLDSHGHRLDLLLTDLTLPDGTGSAVVDAAREHQPDLPIVVMSGLRENPIEPSTGGSVSPPYLAKPFTAEQLLGMVEAAVTAGTAQGGE